MTNKHAGHQVEWDVIHYLRKTVTFNDEGVTSLGWLPARAAVIGGGIVVTTAFDSGTSDTIDIGFRNANDGTSDDDDEYATLLDATTAGFIEMDELATAGDLLTDEGAEVIATYTSTGSAPTAGSAEVIVEYVVDNDGDTTS